MKIPVIFVSLLLLISCKEKVPDSYFTSEKAKSAFSRIEEICNRDGGSLWGTNLNGPVMFVDRTGRKITANQQDNEGILKLKDGVYTGIYPKENIITITSTTFGGTLYGLSPLPLEEDEYRIVTRAIHALYHRFQQLNGINPEYFNALNMDEKDARVWIKLEWKALKKAIDSGGEDQVLAVRDALIFRGANHALFPKYTSLQNKFENYEGLATFTYILLTSESPEDYKVRLFELLDRIYGFQSYARSYGSIHGALYATLLNSKGFNFSTLKSDTVDLAMLVKNTYNVELPSACLDTGRILAEKYDIEKIYEEEDQRIRDIKERLDNQTSIFTQKPVVFLELESPSFDFEPEDIQFLDTLGTLYRAIRVSDNWGKLSVDKTGCLVTNNYKSLRITASGLKVEKNHISGDGWQIFLNEGWELKKSDQDYFLTKLAP